MPLMDGTGPSGQGRMTGRGLGPCGSGVLQTQGTYPYQRTSWWSRALGAFGGIFPVGYGSVRGAGRRGGRGRGQGRGRGTRVMP